MEIEKFENLVANSHDKKEYIIHTINLKQPLNHGLVSKNVHRVIKFNLKAWLKPMNTELRKKARKDFEKDFFELMNNADFGKNMENIRKHRNLKLVNKEASRNYLVSEPNYH